MRKGRSSRRTRFMLVWLALIVADGVGAAPVSGGQPPAAASDAGGAARQVEITAEQFRFVPSSIEVIEGERVRLRIRSIDVTHGLAIPELGVEVRIPAGEEVVVELVAETPGQYAMSCHIFCGTGHGRMTGTVTVLPASGDPGEPAGPAPEGLVVDPVEPDYSLVSLPTTLSLPSNRLAFRLVHRFSRPLDGGPGFGNLLEDFLGFDAPAQIGLELRYGVTSRLQIGVHRNNTRNIQLFGRYRLLEPSGAHGTGLAAVFSIDGLNNFRDEHSPAFGAVLSQRLGAVSVVYVEPMWIENADNEALLHPQTGSFEKTDDDALVVGLGARVRVLDTVSIVAEVLPRLYGFDQGEEYVSFGVEKQAGGHVFQVNVSNSIGTTPVQLAQGASEDWFIGFNITRRF